MAYTTTISGKRITLTSGVGNVVLAGLIEVSVDPQVDELDATTGADGGFGDTDTGVAQAVIEIKIICDVALNPYQSILASTLLTNVKIFRDPVLNLIPICTIPLLKLISSPTTAQVRGRWEATIRGKSRGTFSFNAGG